VRAGVVVLEGGRIVRWPVQHCELDHPPKARP
jgi:hypothetical protein